MYICLMLSGACDVMFESNTDLEVGENAVRRGIKVLVNGAEDKATVRIRYYHLPSYRYAT